MTVREAMTMSANLRIPKSVSKDLKRERVEDLISLLHLNKVSDTQIGDERIRGVSGGEKKRVCIGTELVTNPSILFLDEPTSGLDSFTAYSVMRFLKRIASTGRTVVATLHQPSSEIFHLIDDLMLMASVDYFASQGYACPQYCNPADFFFMSIFHQINPASANTVNIEASDDDVWPITSEGRAFHEQTRNPRTGGFTREDAKFKSTFLDQLPLLFKRYVRNSIRDPSVLGFKCLQVVLFATLFSMIYWKIPQRDQDAQIQDRAGVLFFFVLSLIMSNAMAVLMIFSMEQAVFERENHSGLYGLPAYFFARMAIEIPIYLAMPILLVPCTYFIFGLHPGIDHFFTMMLICALITGLGMSIGLVAASNFRQITVALAVVPLFTLPMMLFAGLFVNLSGMPAWIQWIKWLSPMKYGFVALMKNEFYGLQVGCGERVPTEQCTVRSGTEVLKSLGLEDQGSLWMNTGLIAAYWLALMMISYLGLWRFVRSRRAGRNTKMTNK
ncbi:ABC-2 type transporter-domain-containing protein [Syncephalis plumigaleata]|nr:ABC-2 type transporter-domain-containing protein [Syncephalis plumigaleata]